MFGESLKLEDMSVEQSQVSECSERQRFQYVKQDIEAMTRELEKIRDFVVQNEKE